MNRLLLLCLLASVDAFAGGLPPFIRSEVPVANFPLIDTISPTIQCPPGVTLTLNSGKCDTIYNYTILANDDQPNFILIQLSGLASGSAFSAGNTLNSYLVTDLAGNTATCSFSVKVIEAAVTLECDDFVDINLGAGCTTQLQSADLLNPPFGCTDDDIVTIDKVLPYGNGPWVPGVLTENDAGQSYAYRITDATTGNNCTGSLKVIDTPPAVNCGDITVNCAIDNLAPAFLKDTLGIAAGFPVVNDNCPGVTLTHVDFAQNPPCNPANSISGLVNRIWTATDASGNTKTCQQTIIRQRSFAGIEFPLNIVANCVNEDNVDFTGAPVLTVNGWEFPLWPASFCEFEINYYDTLITADCGGAGKVARTWKIFDLCSPLSPTNPFSGVQVIDFVDESGPAMQCDSSIIISVDAVDCLTPVDLPEIAFEDNCSEVVSVSAYWTANGDPDSLAGVIAVSDNMGVFGETGKFPAGTTTTVRYVATDACGNTGTCETKISVWDMEPPVTGCVTFFTVTLSGNGEFWLGADTLDLDSKDACSDDLFFKMQRTKPSGCQPNDQFYDAVLFCCSDIGDTIELTRRVYDVAVPEGAVAADYAEGQFSDCTVKVEVLDTLPVSCVAPADVTINCTEADPAFADYGNPVFTCAMDSMTVNVDLSQFDSTCREGTVARKFRVFDKNGNSSECVQAISIVHVKDYYIRFPDDVIVTACDSTDNFGAPQFALHGCENLKVTYEDEVLTVVPDACYKIERTWTVYDSCAFIPDGPVTEVPNPEPNAVVNHADNLTGPVVSPDSTAAPWAPTVIKISPVDNQPTNYATFWSANANSYVYKQIIKVIDIKDPLIVNCPAGPVTVSDSTDNNPLLWSQSYWYDPATELLDLAEASVPLSITVTDACSGSNVNLGFLLFLDLDGDGTQETVINSSNTPAPGTVNFNNASNPNFAGGIVRVFDGRPALPNDIYRWALHQSVNGNQRTGSVHWKTFAQMPPTPALFGLPGLAPQLPYGTHRIQWFAADACGNEAFCEYEFTVQDGKAPEISCLSNLQVDMPPAKQVILMTTDFLKTASDNYAPPTKLKYGIRKSGAGNGFPVDANGDPITTVTFDCTELGAQSIDLWVRDLDGHTAFCSAPLTVTDNDGNCTVDPKLSVAGHIRTEIDSAVVNVGVTLDLDNTDLQTQTSQQGLFEFLSAVPPGSEYTLTPSKNDNHQNGVSTFDLVLITKHILGLEPLNSPYKIISADANKSQSVTTFDVVEIRKLILGIYSEFPANTSWRFIDKDFVFPNPFNPFQSAVPESITRNVVVVDQLEEDFVALKVGDVNNTAIPNAVPAPDDRSAGTLDFRLDDRQVQAGEVFTVPFRAAGPALGWQFTLQPKGLEVLDISPGEGLDRSNFAVFEDAVTAAAENGAEAFAITFRAQRAGRLSAMLGVSSRITRAEAYSPAGERLDVALRFGSPEGTTVSGVGFELYQNRPNPFHDKTLIGFHLPEDSEATLSVMDETGRLLYTLPGVYSRGYHTIPLENTLFDATGVLLYKLETPAHSAIRKMILLK